MTYDERASFLLAEAGLQTDPGTLSMASDYLNRTRRGRRYGLIGGFVLGASLPAASGQAMLALPLIPAGYLLGVLVSELLTPLPARGAVRSASLQPRHGGDLLPRWARATYWALLIPVLAAPLLMLIHRAPGVSRIVTADYTCAVSAIASWPRTPLVLAAVLGVAALAIAEMTLAALTRRARPGDDADLARLDDVMRQRSARSIAAGAAAVGLTMLAMICQALDQAGHASVCAVRPPLGLEPAAYPWAASLVPWTSWAGGIFLVAAIFIAFFSAVWRDSISKAIPRGGFA